MPNGDPPVRIEVRAEDLGDWPPPQPISEVLHDTSAQRKATRSVLGTRRPSGLGRASAAGTLGGTPTGHAPVTEHHLGAAANTATVARFGRLSRDRRAMILARIGGGGDYKEREQQLDSFIQREFAGCQLKWGKTRVAQTLQPIVTKSLDVPRGLSEMPEKSAAEQTVAQGLSAQKPPREAADSAKTGFAGLSAPSAPDVNPSAGLVSPEGFASAAGELGTLLSEAGSFAGDVAEITATFATDLGLSTPIIATAVSGAKALKEGGQASWALFKTARLRYIGAETISSVEKAAAQILADVVLLEAGKHGARAAKDITNAVAGGLYGASAITGPVLGAIELAIRIADLFAMWLTTRRVNEVLAGDDKSAINRELLGDCPLLMALVVLTDQLTKLERSGLIAIGADESLDPQLQEMAARAHALMALPDVRAQFEKGEEDHFDKVKSEALNVVRAVPYRLVKKDGTDYYEISRDEMSIREKAIDLVTTIGDHATTAKATVGAAAELTT